MADNPNSAANLRERLEHHQGARVRAEAERGALIARKADGALLSDDELDTLDDEILRLGSVIARAASRMALIAPALAAADKREAEAAERERAAAATMQDRERLLATSSPETAALTSAALRAASTPERPLNPKIFDPPAPIVKREDEEKWWAARDRREREERAARLAAATGQGEPDYSGFHVGRRSA